LHGIAVNVGYNETLGTKQFVLYIKKVYLKMIVYNNKTIKNRDQFLNENWL